MRFVVLIFGVCFLFSQTIDSAIKSNQAKIKKTIAEQGRIEKMIKKLGDQITSQNNELKSLIDEIQVLEKEIEDNQGKFLIQEQEFKKAQQRSKDLQERDKNIQAQITKLIAQELAFRVIVADRQATSSGDIILNELFKTLSKNVQVAISSLTQEKKQISLEIKEISQKIQALQKVLKVQNEKRAMLNQGVKKRNTLIVGLEKDIQSYNERLSKIAKEREGLDEILEKLNIRKQNQKIAKKTQKPKETKRTLANKKEISAPLDVKRMGSSYRQVSTTHYRGKKTIAPLESYEVEQKFGTYFDPVYKIKVFNESVILSPKTHNTNVRNVMDGKVVFAKDTPVLKKVVVIEHANQVHTIYAHLDKIAPTIRPGLRIKRGYIIGKVNEKLAFEVTQKDKHINPLELIQK